MPCAAGMVCVNYKWKLNGEPRGIAIDNREPTPANFGEAVLKACRTALLQFLRDLPIEGIWDPKCIDDQQCKCQLDPEPLQWNPRTEPGPEEIFSFTLQVGREQYMVTFKANAQCKKTEGRCRGTIITGKTYVAIHRETLELGALDSVEHPAIGLVLVEKA